MAKGNKVFSAFSTKVKEYFGALKKLTTENSKAVFIWIIVFVLLGVLFLNHFSIQVSQFFAAPAPATLILKNCTDGRVLLNWNVPDGANSNSIQRRINGGSWEYILQDDTLTRTFLHNVFKKGTVAEYRHKSGANVTSNIVRCPAPAATPVPAGPLPTPTHDIYFGYFFEDGRYGDFSSEVSCYTNLYYAWARRGYEPNSESPDSVWLPLMAQDLKRAADAGKSIILNLNLQETGARQTPVDQVLDIAKPYWNHVVAIELADEADWTKAQTESQITSLKSKIQARGLAVPMLGTILTQNASLTSNVVSANGLDFVSIEAYVDPPGSSNSATNVAALGAYLNQAKSAIPPAKKILIIMMAYARNGAWTNIQTLTDLQKPVYLAAYNDSRVFAITMFSYGRASGTHDHPELKAPHQEIATALGINTCSGGTSPSPTTSTGAPTPTPSVVPATLSLTARMKNISLGDSKEDKIINADPGDKVQLSLAIQASSIAQSVRILTNLPFGLSYVPGSTVVDGSPVVDGITTSGLEIGTVSANQTKTVQFQAQVANADAFSAGSTTLSTKTIINASNATLISDNAFVTVANASGTQNIGLAVFGRNITRGETNFQTYVQANPGDIIEFKANALSFSSAAIDGIDVLETLPNSIAYIAGSTQIDGAAAADDIVSPQGLSLGTLDANQTKTVHFKGRVGSLSAIPSGTTSVVATAQIQATGISPLISQLPVTLVNTGIAGPGQVQTGTSGNAVVVAILISSLVTFMYVAYTRTSMFSTKELRALFRNRKAGEDEINLRK